jgi:hypothetical protein
LGVCGFGALPIRPELVAAGLTKNLIEKVFKCMPAAEVQGSFDFVRLAPHFAQDDKIVEDDKSRKMTIVKDNK